MGALRITTQSQLAERRQGRFPIETLVDELSKHANVTTRLVLNTAGQQTYV